MLPLLAPLVGLGLKTAGLTALKAGLITGVGTAIATKDIGKGLTAGLGAFGGAGLGEAAGTAGQAATAADAVKAVGPATTTGQMVAPNITGQAAAQFANLPDAGARLSSMGDGLSALTSGGEAGAQALQAAGGGGNLLTKTAMAATPALDSAMGMQDPQDQQALIRPYDYDFGSGRYTAGDPFVAKQGGSVPGLNSLVRNFQEGGRFIEGEGDGMSDSIDANIDGVTEAKLSDGEFVIPADIVSHIGNGSSDAGSKRLYSMMDEIRQTRTGKTEQAPEIELMVSLRDVSPTSSPRERIDEFSMVDNEEALNLMPA